MPRKRLVKWYAETYLVPLNEKHGAKLNISLPRLQRFVKWFAENSAWFVQIFLSFGGG